MRFENCTRPPAQKPLTELQVDGHTLDLNRKLEFVGLTWGCDDSVLTLGWVAATEVLIVRGGQGVPLSGLALTFSGLRRFEAAFDRPQPGEFEYLEYREDPDPELLFFFAGGTLRLSAELCRADLLFEEDEGLPGSEPQNGDSGGEPIQ